VGREPNADRATPRVGGRRAALTWLRAARAALPAGRIAVQVGPIINGDLIAGRWLVHREDLPGRPGGTTLVTGTDILRVDDGQVVEVWVG
jgi:predicted SnoaL-like aldol condensation-catalyzing enzyme